MNFTPRALWGGERASHLVGETTDAETEIESSEFLKPGTSEYLTSRREKSKSAFSPMGLVEVVLGGAILLFFVPQVPKEFCRGGTVHVFSVPSAYNLHVPFDVGVGSKP